MKNRKLVISVFIGLLVIGTGIGLSSIKDSQNEDFEATTIDAVTADEKVIEAYDPNIVEIEDGKTPAASGVIGGSASKSVRNLTNEELEIIRNDLIASVNKERKSGAANKLVDENVKLETTGNIRAKEVITLWSHDRPNGTSWETVLPANGISTTNLKAGEDLAKVTATAKSSYSDSYISQISSTLHQSLMSSPTHKAVILNQNYSEIGIGVYSEVRDGKVTVYVVEHFKNATSSQIPAATLTIKGVPTTKPYTGKQIKPAITVYDGSKKLTEGTHYKVTYGANKNTGKATITVEGMGSYNGKKTVNFTIVPKAPTSLKLTAASKGFKVSYGKATGC